MAEQTDSENTMFKAGEKYPLLGVSMEINNPWLRFGLPALTGLAVVFIFFLFA